MDARMEGGLLGGLKRKFLAGESLFLTFFTSSVPSARVAFSGPYPGKIIRFPLQSSAMICQRGSFLCATGEINITVENARITSNVERMVEKTAKEVVSFVDRSTSHYSRRKEAARYVQQ